MRVPWGEHLDIARCCVDMAEHDLAAAAIVMAGGLHLLQRDLLAALWELEDQALAAAADRLQSCSSFCAKSITKEN